MEDDPLSAELRRENRHERLGPNPVCVICGCTDPKKLLRVKRAFLEKHHALGRAHNPRITIIVCRYCHAALGENARDAGADMRKQPTLLHRMVMILRALGSFFVELGKAMCRHAEEIMRLIKGLDEDCSNWRKLPEAK